MSLYAKDQTMVLVADDQWEQEEWYQAVKKLIEEWKDEECREGFSEEDDGYCTLPPAPYFREVSTHFYFFVPAVFLCCFVFYFLWSLCLST